MEKDLKKMKREELIAQIRQYQRREQSLLQENEDLRRQLADKNSRLRNAGSIAQAALSLNHIFEDAQKAADQYLEEIRQLRDQARAGCAAPPQETPKPQPEKPQEEFSIPDLAELDPENWDPDLCLDIPDPEPGDPVPEPAPQEPPRPSPGFRQVRLDSRWLSTAPQNQQPKKPRPAPEPRKPAFTTQEQTDFENLMRSLEQK